MLIDTNVLICREDHHVLPDYVGDLFKEINEARAEVLIHPSSLEELAGDANVERRRVSLSKVSAYPELECPPDPGCDEAFIQVVGAPRERSEEVDNALLYAVRRDAVDLLITEDKGIHRKAEEIGLSGRVLSVRDALSLFQQLSAQSVKGPPALKRVPAHSLNLGDPFFDSFKKEYPDFGDWFRRISRQGRSCWVHFRRDGLLDALLILKIEDEPISCTPPLPRRRRLKICTLKADLRGQRVGELFVKLSTQYAIQKHVEELYLTKFPEPVDPLVDLIKEFGFGRKAQNDRGEDVYVKILKPSQEDLRGLCPSEIAKRYWPIFYDGPEVRKFLVPIRPEYHQRLFVDYPGRQTVMDEHLGKFIIEGNAIKKAYLSHSKITGLRPGDVLLFYRSCDRHEITSVGTVESVLQGCRSPKMIMEQVRGRTVYSMEEIRGMAQKPTLVISFIWHCHLSKPLPFQELMETKIIRGAPRTIVRLPEGRYRQVKRRVAVGGCLTVDQA